MRTIFLVFIASLFIMGCNKDEPSTEETSTRDYFPLAIGNSWTYKCTIPPGCEPLFSLVAEVAMPKTLFCEILARIRRLMLVAIPSGAE